jgi:hypothetical protein
MDHEDDQRTEELNSLRLAMATFALRLDAFEVRLKDRRTQTNAEPRSRSRQLPRLQSKSSGQ